MHGRRAPEQSFVDRFAGLRRKPAGTKTPFFFRFLEIAFAPRVILATGGIMFMGWIAFGDRQHNDSLSPQNVTVPAWFNPHTKRWETPAPWLDEYYQNKHTHRNVHKYLVHESKPPV